MATVDKPTAIPSEIMAELQKAAEDGAKGIRDPEKMRKACERMDRMRVETYRKHGLLDIGVPAVRELRDADRTLVAFQTGPFVGCRVAKVLRVHGVLQIGARHRMSRSAGFEP